MKGRWILSNAFSVLIEMVFFFSHSVNVVYYTG